ncbi:MAG: hypothetical protein CMLOHMNK_03309 [Steroidobacteraceae bacterium]|nr:hypothetical protein [Steroidobacteraceae bacterium]
MLCLPAIAAEPGELWEVTSEMQAAGLKTPPTTQQICAPKDRTNEPRAVPATENCEMYDVRHARDTTRWKVRCTGDPPSSGTGEMTYDGKDRYHGTMRMMVGGDAMLMSMNGRRLGTACDVGQARRGMDIAIAGDAEYEDRACQAGVEAMTAYTFTGATGLRCAPIYRQQYCAALRTEQGFDKVAALGATANGPPELRGDFGAAGALCGLPATGADSIESIRAKLCAQALAKESLEFLRRQCPGEGNAQPQARRSPAPR